MLRGVRIVHSRRNTIPHSRTAVVLPVARNKTTQLTKAPLVFRRGEGAIWGIIGARRGRPSPVRRLRGAFRHHGAASEDPDMAKTSCRAFENTHIKDTEKNKQSQTMDLECTREAALAFFQEATGAPFTDTDTRRQHSLDTRYHHSTTTNQ